MSPIMEYTAYGFFFSLGAYVALCIDRWLMVKDERKAAEKLAEERKLHWRT